MTWSGSWQDRGRSGHGPGQLALGGPTSAGRLDQVTSKIPCKLNHSVTLWPNTQFQFCRCVYIFLHRAEETVKLSWQQENPIVPLKNSCSLFFVSIHSHWLSRYNLLFALVDRYSPPCCLHHCNLHKECNHHGENVWLAYVFAGIEMTAITMTSGHRSLQALDDNRGFGRLCPSPSKLLHQTHTLCFARLPSSFKTRSSAPNLLIKIKPNFIRVSYPSALWPPQAEVVQKE